MSLFEQIEESAAFIRSRTSVAPRVGIILGTGLGDLVGDMTGATAIEYGDIPHFPISTVESHAGRLHLGQLGGKDVCVMQGRFHRYEGYSLQQVTFPVRVMRALGCELLIVMSCVGSVNPAMQAGDVALISDHINLFGDNPLIGANDERLGPRFPDMSEPYTRSLMNLMTAQAAAEGVALQRGVYLGWGGPSLETAAEYRMIHRLGADMVGMSTVPEVIVASHAGMKVLGLATVSNYCDYCNLQPCSLAQILEVCHSAQQKLRRIIPRFLDAL